VSPREDEVTLRTPLYRAEALEHHDGEQREGELLRLSITWPGRAYWLLVAAVAIGIGFCAVGSVNEYASGPAVVRIEDRSDLTATFAATVAQVLARPGQHVEAGAPLIQFVAEDESAERARLDSEFELQLVRVMRDPSDQAARQSLTSLRAQRELAAARVGQRLVRASRAGIISDVRVRAGEHLNPGELIVSIVGDAAPVSLTAVLPGRYRPVLKPGMPLRFELDGERYRYHDLTIESVGDDVVGPAEVRRYLGANAADTVELKGPLVLVRARLEPRAMGDDDAANRYFDGLPGHVDVKVRAESILVSLIPALRALSHHAH